MTTVPPFFPAPPAALRPLVLAARKFALMASVVAGLGRRGLQPCAVAMTC